MSYNEIINLLIKIEEKFPVQQWKINGCHIWPLFRIKIFLALSYPINHPVSNLSHQNKINSTKGLLQKFLNKVNWKNRRIAHLIDDYFINKRLLKGTEVIFVSFPINRSWINQYWFDKILDPIRNYFKAISINTLSLELKGGIPYRTPRYNNYNLELEAYQERYILRNKNVINIPQNLELCDFKPFVDFISDVFPDRSVAQFNEENIKGYLKRFFIQIEFFKEILKRSNPKLAFVSCYYDSNIMAFCAACHSLGVKVVEIQHGLQGSHHGAYSNWNNVPYQGYEMLPDFFWCWNEESVLNIKTWADKNRKHKVILGGNPYMEMWKTDNDPLVQKYQAFIKKENKHNILYTALFDNFLPEEVIKTINESPKEYKWWIRLHPRLLFQLESFSNFLKINCKPGGFNIVEASNLPLPLLLTCMDLHVTHNSSVVLEAEEEGVNSIILDQDAHLLFSDQIQKGKAIICNLKADNLLNCIKKQLEVKREKKNIVRRYETVIDNLLKTIFI